MLQWKRVARDKGKVAMSENSKSSPVCFHPRFRKAPFFEATAGGPHKIWTAVRALLKSGSGAKPDALPNTSTCL